MTFLLLPVILRDIIKLKVVIMKPTPFIIATLAAAVVVGADIFWMAGELLNHTGVISDQVYIGWRLGVLLVLSLGLIVTLYSVLRYVRNGYVRSDKICEMDYLREKCKSKGRRKIFHEKT